MFRYYREKKENQYLFDQDETILDHRFIACLKWYIRKANFYRFIYYITTFLSGVGPLVSVALNNLLFETTKHDWRFLLFLASVVTGMSVLILNMTRAQEKWTNYRTVAEFLKRERTKCLMEKSYHPEKIEEIEYRYAEVIERYMLDENIRWENSNMQDSGKASNSAERTKQNGLTEKQSNSKNNVENNDENWEAESGEDLRENEKETKKKPEGL